MFQVEAKVLDSTHLELAEPIRSRRGQTVLVSVVEAVQDRTEREAWMAASAAGLQGAYGDTEPDYSPSMIKETNPDFGI